MGWWNCNNLPASIGCPSAWHISELTWRFVGESGSNYEFSTIFRPVIKGFHIPIDIDSGPNTVRHFTYTSNYHSVSISLTWQLIIQSKATTHYPLRREREICCKRTAPSHHKLWIQTHSLRCFFVIVVIVGIGTTASRNIQPTGDEEVGSLE